MGTNEEIIKYTGEINEFINWATGQNEETGAYVDGGDSPIPISGESIQALIRQHIKTPFVPYGDKKAGLYRLFSSEAMKNKFIAMMDETNLAEYNPEEAEKLPLFSFVRPGDMSMRLLFDNSVRYIIETDTSSELGNLDMYVFLEKTQAGQVQPAYDTFTVTYTITDGNGTVTTMSVPHNQDDLSAGENKKLVSFKVFNYLKQGTNIIQIKAKADNSDASIDTSVTINLVNFTLESTFDYSTAKTFGSAITIPFIVRRSINDLSLKVTASVNGTQVNSWDSNSKDYVITKDDFSISNNYLGNVVENGLSTHRKYLLRLDAELSGGATNSTFHSNSLFYEFETASTEQIIVNKFINIAYNTPYNKIEIADDYIVLQGTQFEPFILNWTYYTDQMNSNQTVNIEWGIITNSATKPLTVTGASYQKMLTSLGSKGKISDSLRFVSSEAYTLNDNTWLVAVVDNSVIDAYRIIMAENQLDISEASGYNLKLSAFGKSNSSDDRSRWTDLAHNITSTFSPTILFDSIAGWENDSLFLSGTSNTVQVNYVPFPTNGLSGGRTIEIDFKSEKVSNSDDVIAMIGSPTNAHIDITPTAAYLRNTSGASTVTKIQTNFKSNERVKLCFIFNQNGLVYIVNNGILERAANFGDTMSYNDNNGKIRLGGANSGIRVYSIRAYNTALTVRQALNNYIYDNPDEWAELLSRNDIMDGNKIVYSKLAGKIDIITIEGHLSRLLASASKKEQSNTTATIARHCPYDESKDFTVKNGMIRKHGQSTLSYPVPNFKIWLNKSADDGVVPELTLSARQVAMGLNKNRYVMKDGSIPANKFVLQANYADSSGVHNGALERLIQETWYNAKIDGEYKLRTAPQLFASNTTVNHTEASTPWIEGLGTDKGAGKGWKDITGKDFPYIIRNSPDSFPCAVFYKDLDGTEEWTFLGQYVFMDDKKSDHLYGERSIYSFDNNTDPFALKAENSKKDKKDNRVWNNNNVLRIEDILINNALNSFLSMNVPTSFTLDENGDIDTTAGQTVPCTNIKKDERGNNLNYYWEDYFELIYPDPDDIAEDDAKKGLTKFSPNSKFQSTVQPFIDFLTWITGISALNVNHGANRVSQTALDEFIRTAPDHLDIYKMAAYYIFFLRFGLVDSVERNAQLKTYDGQHWCYEPWDMDIALGNTNKGQLVFNPPLDRDSLIPGTVIYAYSGRSNTTSNILWDCFEAWPYWRDTIIHKVAEALFNDGKGLTYDNIIKMMDGNYAEKWSETMYNESGTYKYIKMGGLNWLSWLQGARTTHRHWWVSTSMNYYDAKWECGSFMQHRVELYFDSEPHSPGTDLITIKPTSSTFFKLTAGEGNDNLGTIQAEPTSPAVFDVSSRTFTAKDATYIYGGTFIEEIDLSCFADMLSGADFARCYDDVLGSSIKKVDIGNHYTSTGNNTYTGLVSNTALNFNGSSGGKDALASLQTLDISGQRTVTDTQKFMVENNRRNIENIYAVGSGITSFESSADGNKFNYLKLPGVTTLPDSSVTSMQSIRMHNSSWEHLEWYDAVILGEPTTVQYTQADGTVVEVARGVAANYTLSSVPASILGISYSGSTASNMCAGQLLKDWITAIDNSLPSGHTEEDLYAVLRTKSFHAERINWGSADPNYTLQFTYNDLARLAQFNNGQNANNNLSGYILLSDNQPLTASQLSNLRQWFGESVFDKTAINSSLVIDQNLEYVQLSVSGDAFPENNAIYLKEPETAVLTATKFLLSEDTTEYTWAITHGVNTAPADNSSSWIVLNNESNFSAYPYTLSRDADGVLRLRLKESTLGNYKIWLRVSYVDNLGSIVVKKECINVIGVVYPDTYTFTSDARKFNCTSEIASKYFGSWSSQVVDGISQITDAYVLPGNQGTDFHFGFSLSYPDMTGVNANLATIRDTQFSLLRKGGDESNQHWYSSDSNEYQEFTYNGAPEVGFRVDANTGDVLLRRATDNMCQYKLSVRLLIGGKSYIYKNVNILVMDDSSYVLEQSSAIYSTFYNMYLNLYSVTQGFTMYPSHLLSLSGTVNLSSVTSLTASNGESILRYLRNITGILLSGNLSLTTVGSTDFENMEELTSINASGCTGLNGQTFNLSNNTKLYSVNTFNTTINVVLPENSTIAEYIVGSPSSISIRSPQLLTTSGVTVKSPSNLDSLELINVNATDNIGFNMFGTIMGVN